MAGFYVHIPFCRKVCYYCDFHFVATLKYKDVMLKAILEEIKLRSPQWNHVLFDTLYFGGGTPSVLSAEELNRLTDQITKYYNFSHNIEFTLEANPDDLTEIYLKQLKGATNINRLSIGTQSFHDKDLRLMNRRHTGEEAYNSIYNAQQMGFHNLNIDLIYGTPGLTNAEWEENLLKFVELNVPHLSAYHLRFEAKTVFEHMRKKNRIIPVDEDISQQQYTILINKLRQNNYKHYEISNFAKEGHFSKHNNNYWLGGHYLGIGPSAHSFTGEKRSWNIANNTRYCKSILEDSNDYYTVEELSLTNRFNEYIITSLRTFWGLNTEYIKQTFGEMYVGHTLKVLDKLATDQHFVKTEKGFALKESGWLISDFIMRELFFEE
jgi:oxygen-independent coproporphyrinogen III oxidase